MADLGNCTFKFLMDFGSFRDLQRHRNGVCRMPLLTTKLGFESWYLNQLPDDVRAEADTLIENQKSAIAALDISEEEKQYYIAMGFRVNHHLTYGLPASVYVIELRSGKTVHPTIRPFMHKMHQSLMDEFPTLKMYTDLDADDWDIKRGGQDITKK